MVGGQTATNAGYLEIATADDNNEPIYVRQYKYGDSSNPFGSIQKEAILLNASGNTSFPGTVTAASFSGSIANATGLTKSQVTTALGYTPPTSDTNTTYTFAAGTNSFKVTPSGGSAQTINVTPSVSKSDVGLGSVANLDQSKAIKSITRSGTTFTATALDGTTSTFNQQDNNSDTKVRQSLSTANSNLPLLLSYAANTTTTANVDNVSYRSNSIYANPSTGNLQVTKLNGVDVGNSPKFTDTNTTYSAGSNITLTGTVFSLTKANVTGALGYTPPTTNTTYSNVSTSAAGLAPKVTDTSKYLKGDGTWATPTNTTYSNVSSTSAGLAPKITNTANFLKGDGTWTMPTKANVGLGNVANYDQSKAIKSITRSGTTFTATALDGTTSTFNQQDNNTWTALQVRQMVLLVISMQLHQKMVITQSISGRMALGQFHLILNTLLQQSVLVLQVLALRSPQMILPLGAQEQQLPHQLLMVY